MVELAPSAWGEIVEVELADANSEEAEGGVADGGGHAADLAIFSFDKFEAEPAGRDGFAETDGGGTRWDFRLGIKNPGVTRQGFASLHNDSFGELLQGLFCGDALDLGPVFTGVSVARVQEFFVQVWFVAQEEQAFGIGIQSADGVDMSREMEFGECLADRTVGGELGEDAKGFVKGEEHSEGQI